MNDTDLEAPKAPWGKRIAIFLGLLVVLLVVVYFVGTSSAFVKAVVLPRVGSAINAKVTAADISLSPFSQLYARQLRVETTGAEPLLTAEEVRVRYSLMDIIKGNIKVNELTLVTPVINLVQDPDGSSNLDPITKGESKPSEPSKEPTRLSVQNVSIKDGTVRQTQKAKDGSVSTTELKGLSVNLDRIGNGQTGHLQLAASITMNQKQGGTNSTLAGDLSGGYDIALNQELMPETVKGSAKLNIARADGSFADLAGFTGALDADLTPKEIRQVALQFARNNQPLGQVRLSGPLDIDKKEGTLKVEVNSIDKNVLALLAAGKGYDFGNTTVNSTNQINISQGGTFFSANGLLAATRVTLAQGAMKTPEMNLTLDYQVGVNTSEKSATLQKLNLSGSTGGNQFLRGELDRQMNLSWGETVKGYRDAALNILLTNFNLGDWRAMLGTNINSGVVNANLALVSQQDGRMLKTDLAAQINGLNAVSGSNHIENASLTLQSTGSIEQLNVVVLPNYTLTLSQGGSQVLQASGSARYVMDSKDTTAQLNIEGALPRLLALAALTDPAASAGTLKASLKYTDNGNKRNATGNVVVNEFTGRYDTYAFTNYTIGLECNVDVDSREATLNRTALTFSQGFNRGGTVDVKGKYNLENKSGEFSFNTVDLNQNFFAPVLAPSLGENQLVSINMNASGQAKLDPQGESAITADVKVANWIVQDKAGTLPKEPLAVDLKVDGGMKKEVLDLRQFLVQLTPTPRAKNSLLLQAKLDLSKTNPAPGTITISSESFDVTPYYDMFAGKPASSVAGTPGAPAPATPSPAAAPAEQEPEPMQLPFQQLTADLKIDQLFLRDLAISNWVGKVAIHTNVVQLNPFQMDVNGGPMSLSGTVNVGWPGYMYDLALKADRVPLAPLANTFGSGASNQLQGNLFANGQIRGAGTTGPNLRKNLGGNLNLNLTNLNYQVVGPKLRRILVPISIALRVPELAETPINWVSAQTDIGDGVVNLKHLGVESEAFYAESSGAITLADVITNSTLNLPLDLSLRRSLAEKTRLISADTPTNAKYAKLPRFVSIKGTVGAPDTDINKLAIAGLIARGAAGFGLGDAKTEKALGAVGSLLTGQSGSTNAAGTNASASSAIAQTIGGLLGGNKTEGTNAPAATNNSGGNLLRGLGGLLGGQQTTATNATGVNTNNAPNNTATNAVQNALDSLFRSRKK